jgi:hypothetical protein
MAATLTAYNAALKRIYPHERLEEQLYQDTPVLSKIEKTERFSIGELARVPLHVSRNGGYTALPAGGGTLNTAGNQGLNKAEYTYTHHHQPIAIQGDVLDQTNGNSLSVANVLTTEVDGALTDLRRALQRQLYLNGDALIARCKASDTNDVDLNYSGVEAITRGWIYEGMQFDLGTTASETAIVDGGTVTAVAADQFTSDSGNVTTEGTTHYVSHKNARTGTTSYEMNGLRNIVSSTATLGGLTPSSTSIWQAANVDTTAQPLTLSLMLQQDQAVHQKTGKKADTVVTGLKQARKFYELLQQQVRFSGDGAIGAGDDEAPSWNGMKIFTDPDCWDEDMYFLQLKHLFLVAIDKPYWQNKHTGGDILTWSQGTDSYVAKISYRINLATDRRNAFARLGATADLSATASGLT